MKLEEQKNGRWNEDDRLELARLLIKGGYQVAVRKSKAAGKGAARAYVEVVGDGEKEESTL